MTQLAPAFDTANPQDATTSTEPVEEPQEEVVSSEPESEVVEEVVEDSQKGKPTFKPGPPKTVPIERFNEIYGQMRRLDRLAMQLLNERKGQKTEKKEPEVEPDYDSMTPRQLVDHIRKSTREDMKAVLSETLTPLQEQTRIREASDSISRAAAKHSDFFDYREEMIEIAEKHPQLDAEEVYLIASGQKGVAGDKIMSRVKEKVQQKKNALTTRRSSLSQTTNKPQSFRSIREGAIAAAKAQGMEVD